MTPESQFILVYVGIPGTVGLFAGIAYAGWRRRRPEPEFWGLIGGVVGACWFLTVPAGVVVLVLWGWYRLVRRIAERARAPKRVKPVVDDTFQRIPDPYLRAAEREVERMIAP